MFKMAGEKDGSNDKASDDFETKMIDKMTMIAIYRNVKSVDKNLLDERRGQRAISPSPHSVVCKSISTVQIFNWC